MPAGPTGNISLNTATLGQLQVHNMGNRTVGFKRVYEASENTIQFRTLMLGAESSPGDYTSRLFIDGKLIKESSVTVNIPEGFSAGTVAADIKSNKVHLSQ